MLKNIAILLCASFLTIACSKTVKGPVTGKKYDVKIGGWSDMDKYRGARESVDKDENSRDNSEECNLVDCPDDVTSGLK